MEVSRTEYYEKKINDLRAEAEFERMCRMLTGFVVSTGVSHISVEASKADNGLLYNTVWVHFGKNVAVRHSREKDGWADGILEEARTKEV